MDGPATAVDSQRLNKLVSGLWEVCMLDLVDCQKSVQTKQGPIPKKYNTFKQSFNTLYLATCSELDEEHHEEILNKVNKWVCNGEYTKHGFWDGRDLFIEYQKQLHGKNLLEVRR